MAERRACRAVAALLSVGLAVALAACDVPAEEGPSPSPGVPDVTVMTTDRFETIDPAAVVDQGSTTVALNVFQRLMVGEPGAGVLKPDAARDCIVDTPKVYECTLNEGLTFHNGHALTSSDVKFSVERALRLDVAGSSTSLLSSLQRIDTPDDLTVRFVLSREDTQFGFALASPAASIVDEEVYDPDSVRQNSEQAIGSGPYRMEEYSTEQITLAAHGTYVGRTAARSQLVDLVRAEDSAAIEEAMRDGEVDLVWRGLSAPARTRFAQQVDASADGRTEDGYVQQIMPSTRIRQLWWNPGSEYADHEPVRTAIASALQQDRVTDSVVPLGVLGHSSAFEVGGEADVEISWKKRVRLTLSYDSSVPESHDMASTIRSRLEETGGLSVKLVADDAHADLALHDRKAWTSTAIAWLQPYLDNPSADSAKEVSATEADYRATRDPVSSEAMKLLADLQKLAAEDELILPIDQQDEQIYLAQGVEIAPTSFGSGWHLGLWGVARA